MKHCWLCEHPVADNAAIDGLLRSALEEAELVMCAACEAQCHLGVSDSYVPRGLVLFAFIRPKWAAPGYIYASTAPDVGGLDLLFLLDPPKFTHWAGVHKASANYLFVKAT